MGTYFEKAGFTYATLLELDELGVVNGVQGMGGLEKQVKSNVPNRFEYALISFNKALLITSDDQNAEIDIPIYKITRVGREIMSLGRFVADEDYLRIVADYVKKKGFTVSLGDWKRVSDREGILKNLRVL